MICSLSDHLATNNFFALEFFLYDHVDPTGNRAAVLGSFYSNGILVAN